MATNWKITRLFFHCSRTSYKTGPGYNTQSTLAVVFVQYGVKRVPAT